MGADAIKPEVIIPESDAVLSLGGDEPEVMDRALSTLTKAPPLVDRILADPQYAAIAKQQLERALDTLRFVSIAAVRETFPSDWIIYRSRTPAGQDIEVAYLQDVGCHRAAKAWRLVRKIRSRGREDLPDGSYIYRFEGAGLCLYTGRAVEEIGTAWSGDRFFERLAESRGMRLVDPTLVEKKAIANFDGRIFRALSGLGYVPPSYLAECWQDASKLLQCRRVEFRDKRGSAEEPATQRPAPPRQEAPRQEAQTARGPATEKPAPSPAAPAQGGVGAVVDPAVVEDLCTSFAQAPDANGIEALFASALKQPWWLKAAPEQRERVIGARDAARKRIAGGAA